MFPKCATAEILKAIRDEKVQMIDRASPTCLGCGSIFPSRRVQRVSTLSAKALDLTPHPSAASRKFRKATSGRPGPNHRLPRPGSPGIDPGPDLQHQGPRDRPTL